MENAVVESKGIKESLEILEGLNVVVPAIVEIVADKDLSMKDTAPALAAIKQYAVVIEAVKNGGDAIGEAKDYDMSELAIIGAKTMEIIKNVKEAYAKGK